MNKSWMLKPDFHPYDAFDIRKTGDGEAAIDIIGYDRGKCHTSILTVTNDGDGIALAIREATDEERRPFAAQEKEAVEAASRHYETIIKASSIDDIRNIKITPYDEGTDRMYILFGKGMYFYAYFDTAKPDVPAWCIQYMLRDMDAQDKGIINAVKQGIGRSKNTADGDVMLSCIYRGVRAMYPDDEDINLRDEFGASDIPSVISDALS